MKNKFKELVVNETSVYTDEINKTIYRIIELTYINENKRLRTFAVEVEKVKDFTTVTERIDSFSNNLTETIEFVNYLIKEKVTPFNIFDEALKYLSLRIDKLASENIEVLN
jgi:pimeloyl-CoA synthetase